MRVRLGMKLRVDWVLQNVPPVPNKIVAPDTGRCVGSRMAHMMMRAHRVGAGEIGEVRKLVRAWQG